MLHYRSRKGILFEGKADDPPTGDKKKQSKRRNDRAGLVHQVKSEYVQRNEDNQT